VINIKIILNPDKKYVKEIREAIKLNQGYCCCKLENTIQNFCPCKEFRETKECCCELYIKEEENT